MATPPNLVQIAFSGGIDESSVDEVVDPNESFLVLQNGRHTRQGGYDKRLGTQPLTRGRIGGTTRTAGARLASFRGSPIVIDGSTLDAYAEEATSFAPCGRVPDCTYKLSPLPTLAKGYVVTDVEFVTGFACIGYSGGVAVVTRATGAVVGPVKDYGVSLSSVTWVASCSDRYFFAATFQGTSNTLYLISFDTQNPGAGWTSLATLTSINSVAIASSTDRVILTYGDTTTVTARAYNGAGSIGGSSVTVASVANAVVDVSLSADKSVAWLAYYTSGATVSLTARSTTALGTIIAPAATLTFSYGGQICVVPGDTNATAQVFGSLSTGVTAGLGARVMSATATISGGTITYGTATTNGGVRLSGKGIRRNGRTLLPVFGSPDQFTQNNVQGTLTIVDATDLATNSAGTTLVMRPIANVEPGLIAQNQNAWLSKLALDATGRLFFGFSMYSGGGFSRFYTSPTETPTNARLVELVFTTNARWQTAEHSEALFIGGAVLSCFDGSVTTEAGFINCPSQPAIIASVTGVLTGTYSYVATYEDVDASGRWVVSGVSQPVSSGAVTTKQIQVFTNALSVSSRPMKGTARICFYRTTAGGNTPYYRVGSVSTDSAFDTRSITDNMSDAVLAGMPKLYAPNLPGTAAEALDRRAPPGLIDVVTYNGMLVGVKGSSVVYSGQPVYGEATWFNPVFEIPVYGGGDFVGLEVLDGVVYLFKSDRIFVVAGTAPTDSASSLGLGDVTSLASDVGCIDANSIVSTSGGIFFRSTRGIELVDRSGTATFVGFKVTKTLTQYPNVTSAKLDARNSVVRFSLASSMTNGVVSGAGRDLVYDLKLRVWVSVDDKVGQVAHEASQDASIVTVGGVARYAWLGVDGYVYVESLASDASAYLDGAAFIMRIAETASFKLGGIQGTQQVNSVMLLERRATDHDASIALAYNYESAFRSPTTWTAATIGANLTAGWPVTQLKHQPHDDAICQGIRIRITDSTPSSGTVGTGQGSTWIALSLDITPKAGIFDVPDIAT